MTIARSPSSFSIGIATVLAIRWFTVRNLKSRAILPPPSLPFTHASSRLRHFSHLRTPIDTSIIRLGPKHDKKQTRLVNRKAPVFFSIPLVGSRAPLPFSSRSRVSGSRGVHTPYPALSLPRRKMDNFHLAGGAAGHVRHTQQTMHSMTRPLADTSQSSLAEIIDKRTRICTLFLSAKNFQIRKQFLDKVLSTVCVFSGHFENLWIITFIHLSGVISSSTHKQTWRKYGGKAFPRRVP